MVRFSRESWEKIYLEHQLHTYNRISWKQKEELVKICKDLEISKDQWPFLKWIPGQFMGKAMIGMDEIRKVKRFKLWGGESSIILEGNEVMVKIRRGRVKKGTTDLVKLWCFKELCWSWNLWRIWFGILHCKTVRIGL